MADDLEAFLRRAAQRRAQRKQSARPASRSPEPLTPQTPPVQAKPPVAPKRRSVQSLAMQTPEKPDKFEQREKELGREVGLADDKVEAHLHTKFDHKIGQLDTDRETIVGQADTPQEEEPDAADELMSLLRNPTSLRQAILLSEILRRPDERW